jgi:hypothetical protein
MKTTTLFPILFLASAVAAARVDREYAFFGFTPEFWAQFIVGLIAIEILCAILYLLKQSLSLFNKRR